METQINIEGMLEAMLKGSLEAGQQLEALTHQQDTLPLFLNSYKTSQNPTTRQFCIIVMRKMLENFQYPPDYSFGLFTELTNAITAEQDTNIRYNICELSTHLKLSEENMSALQLLPFSVSLLQSGQLPLISTSLYLFQTFFNNLPDEQKISVSEDLYPVCIQNFINDDNECRYQSIRLLYLLVSDSFCSDSIKQNVDFPQVLINAATRVNCQPNINPMESTELFNLIDYVIKEGFPYFDELLMPFAEFFAEFIANIQVNPLVRLSATDILGSLLGIAIDSIYPIYPKIVQNSIRFAIELAMISPESEEFIFLREMVVVLKNSLDQTDDLFEKLYQFSESLVKSPNLMESRIGFTLLSEVVTINTESTAEYLDNISQLIVMGLSRNDNPFIPYASADVISALCHYDPDDIISYVDVLLPSLFNCLNIPKCIFAIIDVLEVTQEPPEHFSDYLHAVIGCLPSAGESFQCVLIELLIVLLNQLEEIDESIFPGVQPVVVHFLNGDATQKSQAIHCFGYLARVCPRSVGGSVAECIKNSLSLISEFDHEVNTNIMKFLEEVLTSQIAVIAPYVPEIFEMLKKVLNIKFSDLNNLENEGENDDENEEDEDIKYQKMLNDYDDMIQSAISLLVKICSVFPQQTSVFFQSVFNILQSYIDNESETISIPAVKAFDTLSEAYLAIGSDADPILAVLLNQLRGENLSSIEYIASIWNTVALVMGNAGKPLIERRAIEIASMLKNIFLRSQNMFTDKRDAFEIRAEIRAPVFLALETMIEEMGIECISDGLIGEIIPVLKDMTTRVQTKTHSDAGRVLAMIASLSPNETEDLMQTALLVANNNIKKKSAYLRSAAFSTYCIVLRSRQDLIFPIKNDLLQVCNSVIERVKAGAAVDAPNVKGAASLWMLIVSTFNLAELINIQNVAEILKFAETDENSPDFVYSALFAAFCQPFGQQLMQPLVTIACYVFTSPQSVLRHIGQEVLTVLASYIKATPREAIDETMQYNAYNTMKLQNNLAPFLS